MKTVSFRKAIAVFLTFLMVIMLSPIAKAKPGGGGGKPSGNNAAPVITLESIIPTLTEDVETEALITLRAVDKEKNSFSWKILSVSFGTAALEGAINPKGAGSIDVRYRALENENGTAAIIIQAKDNKGAASTLTLSINVLPINDLPVNTILPSINGNIEAGQTALAKEGVWSDAETPAASLTYNYQWQIADSIDGANAADIEGANTNVLQLNDSYTGKYIRVFVTVTDTGDGLSEPLSIGAASIWYNVGQKAQEAQYYVALGDSIAAGTDNKNIFGNSYRYTNTFSNALAEMFSNTSYSYKNDSMPGDTTDDLLLKLQNNIVIRSDARDATIITISIGGNNVLSSAAPEGYSKINDTAALAGVANFAEDIPAIVEQINALHSQDHLPQIYIMDLYNVFHPWERGWVVYDNGNTEEVFMNQTIYEKYLVNMQNAIDEVAAAHDNVYCVNTYNAFESYENRFTINDTSLLKQDDSFKSPINPDGYYFYSSYIEKAAVYNDNLTRFDIYPYYPILFDYFNLHKYRDPHPEEMGHNALCQAHILKFIEVNQR